MPAKKSIDKMSLTELRKQSAELDQERADLNEHIREVNEELAAKEAAEAQANPPERLNVAQEIATPGVESGEGVGPK